MLATDGGLVSAQQADHAPIPDDFWVLRAPPTLPEPEPMGPADVLAADRGWVHYTVEEDDSLWTIAQRQLGDANRWPEITDANPGIDPDRLRVGQRLRLPGGPTRGRVALNHAVAVGPAASPRGQVDSTYTVRAGDTLSTIAKTHYNDGTRWQIIYHANRTKIGWDPDRLKVGMKLRIP